MKSLDNIERKLILDGRIKGENVFASNGSKSLLYDELAKIQGDKKGYETYLTVHSDKFKSWFGDWENRKKSFSKFLDINGEPKIFYHGTQKKFDSFSNNSRDVYDLDDDFKIGIYFSSDSEYARNFTYGDGEVLPVFLKAINPKKKRFIKSNYVNSYLNKKNILYSIKNKFGKLKGIDAFFGLDKPSDDFSKNGDSVVVFDPNQIKSIYNSGKFDSSSDVIFD